MPEPLHTLQVDLTASRRDRSYPIIIGRDLITDTLIWDVQIGKRGVVLVTDDQVGPLYASTFKDAIGDRSPLTEIILASGEANKQLVSVQRILDAALKDRQERQSVFVALGGGVVGDVTGFAAACFLRGADYIQVPTTLLAQVDSSVGGKTGVNHQMGKNLIGAFHQPKCVVIDLATLQTLPQREYVAGLAEVIKYGLIRDPEFFNRLVKSRSALRHRDQTILASAIERSCAIKKSVVMADEREEGVRAHLNFGHTFGHAIERNQGYGGWLHGEAIAAGMVIAAQISVRRGYLEKIVLDQLIDFNKEMGLPVKPPPDMSAAAFLEAMASDKKVTEGKVRYILLRALGKPFVTDDVTESEISDVIGA